MCKNVFAVSYPGVDVYGRMLVITGVMFIGLVFRAVEIKFETM